MLIYKILSIFSLYLKNIFYGMYSASWIIYCRNLDCIIVVVWIEKKLLGSLVSGDSVWIGGFLIITWLFRLLYSKLGRIQIRIVWSNRFCIIRNGCSRIYIGKILQNLIRVFLGSILVSRICDCEFSQTYYVD